MTRKDFELIAATVRAETANAATYREPLARQIATDTLERVAIRFAVALAQTNGRFDINRFKAACGHDQA